LPAPAAAEAVPDTVPLRRTVLGAPVERRSRRIFAANDVSEQRNGHATARIESTGAAGIGQSAKLVRIEHATDDWRGKRVRVRAMIKADRLIGTAGPYAFASAGYFNEARYIEAASKPAMSVTNGTSWLRYTTTLDVPRQTESLEYLVKLEGTGTLWIDDVVLEALP